MFGLENLLRRARIRSLKEGKVQTARAESLEGDAKDEAERWQDYGFAANVVEGQGLVINAGGHTIVLRMDRIAERPQLAAHEVSVWHKEGHKVTLRNGKLVEVDCNTLRVNAAFSIELNTPLLAVQGGLQTGGNAVIGGTMAITGQSTHLAKITAPQLLLAGKVIEGHNHNDLTSGGTTGPNN